MESSGTSDGVTGTTQTSANEVGTKDSQVRLENNSFVCSNQNSTTDFLQLTGSLAFAEKSDNTEKDVCDNLDIALRME